MLRTVIQKLERKGSDRQVGKPVTMGACWLPSLLVPPEAGVRWGLHEVECWSCCGHGASPVCWIADPLSPSIYMTF